MGTYIGRVVDKDESFCVINGEKIYYPTGVNNHSVTMIDNHIFIGGYEYKNGQWKRTLRALWHMWF